MVFFSFSARPTFALLVGGLCALGLVLGERPAQGQTTRSPSKTECQDGTAEGYPCQNVDLLSHLPIGDLGGGQLNDIWGWTDPQTGDEYAVVGRTNGTAFVDISDPTNPVYLGNLPSHTFSSTWRDVKVYQSHAYIVSEASGHGLQVFDLTQLRSIDNPPVTFEETAHYGRFSNAHNIAINTESGYAYVVGITGEQDVPSSADCGAGLHMIDLSTPDDPQFAGCFNDLSTGGQVAQGYTHDAQCVMYQGPDDDYQGREICFNANESQVNIADVTDKENVETITNATYPRTGYTHQAWLTEDQRYLYVDDETDEQSRPSVEKTRTLVFDVSDLDNPELVKTFSGETGAIDHNQYIKGSFAYQANYEAGLRILNVSSPENPVEVAYFDTYPRANSAAFNGAWSNYPFFDSGIVIVSSIGEGLFVLEPTISFGAPTGLSAEVGDGNTIQLRWSISDGLSSQGDAKTSNSRRYRIYRSTSPIDPSSETVDDLVIDSVSAGITSYVDTVEEGRYYYRVTAVDASGTESAFSNESSVFLYPQEISVSISRSFGAAAQASDYRLVALPGRGEQVLSDVISGAPGIEWQAYLDNGSEEDYLVRFDESDDFTFRPGNGFWLTATEDWTFSGDVQTVELRGDSVAKVALRDEWNVISNPLGKDVDWAAVEAANGADLQPIWSFGGTFDSTATFASAATGKAYYFFNGDSERDSLVIPYPGAAGSDAASGTPEQKQGKPTTLALTAAPATEKDGSGSTVEVAIDKQAKPGLDNKDLVAPPGRFEPISLRLRTPGATESARAQLLMRDARPPAPTDGHTFDVRLTSQVDGPVRLTVQIAEDLSGRNAVLLHPSAGATYDLRADETISVEPNGETTSLQLAIGTTAYVQSQADRVLPEEVQLAAYPNPIEQAGTLEYTLPEATEITLRVYDVLGREVATLAQGTKEAGRHTARIGTEVLSNGVYFGRLEAGNQTRTQKIVVVR